MAVWYLDNDDEITDAVARLRGSDDEQVVFVVPPGSRIATGRINFKLLAREAASRDLGMAVASPDEQVRAMAASAGVIARATPEEAQTALEQGPESLDQSVPKPPRPAPAPAAVTNDEPDAGGVLTWRSQRLRVATVVVLAAVIVVGILITTVLPTADISLTPTITALGPVQADVTATTDATEPDPDAGLIPATVLTIPLAADYTHEVRGVKVTDTKARGEVEFSALDQVGDRDIEEGTRVETPGGIAFRTTQTVTLPASEAGSLTTATAPIEALDGGEIGNRDPGDISEAPTLASQGISVDNPTATSGGRSETSPLVEPEDYADAAANLKNLLQGELDARLDDAAMAPEGLTVFEETQLLGPIAREPAQESVVGTSSAELWLTGSAVAQVLAVDEAHVDAVTSARLEAAVPEGMRLIEGSPAVEHGEGLVDGQRITFEGRASGRATPLIDVESLAAEIAGLPVSEAKAILDELGSATVNVWPGFLGDLPNDRQRIRLDVIDASDTE